MADLELDYTELQASADMLKRFGGLDSAATELPSISDCESSEVSEAYDVASAAIARQHDSLYASIANIGDYITASIATFAEVDANLAAYESE